jgi:hypothetical protein
MKSSDNSLSAAFWRLGRKRVIKFTFSIFVLGLLFYISIFNFSFKVNIHMFHMFHPISQEAPQPSQTKKSTHLGFSPFSVPQRPQNKTRHTTGVTGILLGSTVGDEITRSTCHVGILPLLGVDVVYCCVVFITQASFLGRWTHPRQICDNHRTSPTLGAIRMAYVGYKWLCKYYIIYMTLMYTTAARNAFDISSGWARPCQTAWEPEPL